MNITTTTNDIQSKKIVALPCAHAFHASCLMPWFSRPRQATCPTCRFNIDPDDLTYIYRPTLRNDSNGSVNTPANSTHSAADAALPQLIQNLQSSTPPDLQSSRPANDTPERLLHTPNTYPLTVEPVVEGSDTLAALSNIGESVSSRGPVLPPFLHAHINSMPMFGSPSGTDPMVTVNFDFDFIIADASAAGTEPPVEPFVRNVTNTSDNTMLPNINQVFGAFPPFLAFGPSRNWVQPNQRSQPKKEWVLPAAPGLTLRQRVEKQEREAGLRCWDTSCGVGPTDDDPYAHIPNTRQISIHKRGDLNAKVCLHTFHSECLVTAERVAGWGAEEHFEPEIEVACPLCRAAGVVTHQEWEEGDHSSV